MSVAQSNDWTCLHISTTFFHPARILGEQRTRQRPAWFAVKFAVLHEYGLDAGASHWQIRHRYRAQ